MKNDPFALLWEPLSTYAQLALVLLVVLVIVRQLLKAVRQTRAQKQHAWNENRSWKDLARIREIGPRANPGPCFAWLRKVNPYRFEEMILSELARRGLSITRNQAYSGDGGIDGQFRIGQQLWLIQAKRYAGSIKQEHVWAFDAICQQRNALGLFVHTGKTPEALRKLNRQAGDVRIISGDELMGFFAGERLDLSFAPVDRLGPIAAGKPRLAPVHSRKREAAEGAAL